MRQLVDVAPALALTAALAPSVADLRQLVLRLDAENVQGLGSLRLRQLSCTRPGWALRSLRASGDAAASTDSLAPDAPDPGAPQTPDPEAHPPAPKGATEVLSLALAAGERAALFFCLRPLMDAMPSADAGVQPGLVTKSLFCSSLPVGLTPTTMPELAERGALFYLLMVFAPAPTSLQAVPFVVLMCRHCKLVIGHYCTRRFGRGP